MRITISTLILALLLACSCATTGEQSISSTPEPATQQDTIVIAEINYTDAGVTLPQPGSVYLDPSSRLGERFYGNVDFIKYLHEEHGERMLEAFASRAYTPGGFLEDVWDREYGGKWLDAAIRTAANTGDKSQLATVDAFAAGILARQQANGYVGIELPTDRKLNLWEQQWDLWNQWYALTGFLSYYEFRGDEKYLEAASHVAGWIVEEFGPIENENARFLTVGDLDGGTNVAVIGQLVRLYRHTGNEKLTEFVGQVLEHYIPIQRMISTGVPELTHPYMLSAYLGGLAEYADAIQDYKTLAWVEYIWQRMANDHLYPTGSLGEGEKLRPGDLKDKPDAAFQETCATTEWIFFTQSLYTITGRAKYVEALETTFFNALLAAQSQDGMKWCYFTPLRYHKDWMHGPTNCCFWSGPRAVARFPQLIYAVKGDKVHVNFFETSRATLATGSGEVIVAQESEFPLNGQSKVTIESASNWSGSLCIRIPTWTTEFSVLVNEEPAQNSTDENGYYNVTLPEAKKHDVTVRFDIPIVREPFADSFFMRRGPEVLSIDARDNMQTHLDYVAFYEGMDLQPAISDGSRRRYSSDLLYATSPRIPRNLMFTPYADAGNNGARYKTIFRMRKQEDLRRIPADRP